jgi:hypothetical protein
LSCLSNRFWNFLWFLCSLPIDPKLGFRCTPCVYKKIFQLYQYLRSI